MKPDILAKLSAEFEKGINTEAQAAYVLFQIRKLLDLGPPRKAFFSLRFYCDWVVHTSMDREGARRILKLFDDAVDAGPTLHSAKGTIDDKLTRPLWLTTFRDEIRKFLSSHGVSAPMVEDQGQWATFLGLYGRIVEDCPLTWKQHGRQVESEREPMELKRLAKVTLRKLDLADNSDAPFAMEWRFHFKKGGSDRYCFLPC